MVLFCKINSNIPFLFEIPVKYTVLHKRYIELCICYLRFPPTVRLLFKSTIWLLKEVLSTIPFLCETPPSTCSLFIILQVYVYCVGYSNYTFGVWNCSSHSVFLNCLSTFAFFCSYLSIPVFVYVCVWWDGSLTFTLT